MRALAAALLSLFLARPAYGEEDYQRYDLLRDKNSLTIEGILDYHAETIAEAEAYTARPQLALEYTFKNHAMKGALPYVFTAYNKQDAKNQWFYAFGDLNLSYEYLKQFGHRNLFLEGFLGIPLAETNEYMVREGVLAGGSGRYNLGIKVSLTGIQDPVVWNLSFQYGIGMPKEERFYWSWQPGNMQISAGISHLFNETFGLSLNACQIIKLPPVNSGTIRSDDLRLSTYFRPEVFILMNDTWYVRVGCDLYAHPVNTPVVIVVPLKIT
jgi:hypothetical protein